MALFRRWSFTGCHVVARQPTMMRVDSFV